MEKKTTIIGIRVKPALKQMLVAIAAKRKKTLSQFVYDLICGGWLNLNVKQTQGDAKHEQTT